MIAFSRSATAAFTVLSALAGRYGHAQAQRSAVSIDQITAAVRALPPSHPLVSAALDAADRLIIRGAPPDSIRMLLEAVGSHANSVATWPYVQMEGFFGGSMNSLSSSGPGVLARLAAIQLAIGDTAGAEATIAIAQRGLGSKPLTSTDRSYLGLLPRLGRVDEALNKTDGQEGDIRAQMRAQVAAGLAESGRVDDALTIVRAIADREQRRFGFLWIAQASARVGNAAAAVSGARAAAAIKPLESLELNEMADSMCVVASRCDAFLPLLRSIGIPQTSDIATLALGRVVEARVRRGDVRGARALAGTESYLLNQIVWTSGDNRDYTTAFAVAAMQRQRAPKAYAYGNLTKRALEQGDVSNAKRALLLLSAAKLDTIPYGASTYRAFVLDQMARVGDIAGMRSLPPSFRTGDARAMYTAAVSAAAVTPQTIDRFWTTLDEADIAGGWPRALALSVAASRCASAGDSSMATELLRQAKDMLKETKTPYPRIYGWFEVAITLAMLGDRHGALAAFGEAFNALESLTRIDQAGVIDDLAVWVGLAGQQQLLLDPQAPPSVARHSVEIATAHM